MSSSRDTVAVKNGHHPNISNVLLEIYRLLTIFMASEAIASTSPSLYRQLREFESDEITRILLTVAITVRVVDDRESRVMDLVADDCGILTRDSKNPLQTTGLTIREACNKIVHASKIEVEQAWLSDGGRFLKPTIHLLGTDQKKNTWQATLDVVRYCSECTDILKHYLLG